MCDREIVGEIPDPGPVVASLEILLALAVPGGRGVEARFVPGLRLVAGPADDGGRRLTVDADGFVALDAVVTEGCPLRVVRFVPGPWIAQVHLAAVALRWSVWGKPEPTVPNERGAPPGRPGLRERRRPARITGTLVRRIASAVAARGHVDHRDGPCAILRTEDLTAGLTLVRGEAILMIHGDRGLALVAVLDRTAPHRLVTMSCREPGRWLSDRARSLGRSADAQSLTRFCARAA